MGKLFLHLRSTSFHALIETLRNLRLWDTTFQGHLRSQIEIDPPVANYAAKQEAKQTNTATFLGRERCMAGVKKYEAARKKTQQRGLSSSL